jgi:N-acetylmuramoyl-L-alanine amidase
LQRKGQGWASYTGVRIADPVLARHRNGNPDGSSGPIGWERFPPAQNAAATAVARAILAAFPTIREIVGHDDIAPGRKVDPGPAFDMAAFRRAVLG